MKKEIAFMLTAAALGTVCFSNLTADNVSAKTSGNYEYTVTNESKKTCTIDAYKGSKKNVKVPSKIKGYKVTKIGKKAFSKNKNIKKVSLPDTVKVIGDEAFSSSSLQKIDIPKKVTRIGKKAFQNSALKTVKLPKIGKIEQGTFQDCSKLKEVTLSSGLKSVEKDAFKSCATLKKIKLPKGVTVLEDSAFRFCTSLKEIKLSDGLNRIGEFAFYECDSLKEVKLPDSVASIGKCAFFSKGLETVRIPEYLEKTDLRWIFESESLKSISVSEGNKFYDSRNNCNAVIEKETNTLVLGCQNTVIPEAVTIGESISNENEGYYSVFVSFPSSIVIPEGIEKIPAHVFSKEYSDNTAIKNVTLPSTLKTIGEDAFFRCTSLKEIKIPDGVESIESGVFAYSGLEKITLPDNITTIGSDAFADSGLTEINIPKNLKTIYGNPFRSCNLNSIKVAPENKYFETDEKCNALIEKATGTLIKATNNTVIPSYVTKIGEYSFSDLSEITELTIPSSVKEIGDVFVAGFCTCDKLKTINYTGSKADWEKIKIARPTDIDGKTINYDYKG